MEFNYIMFIITCPYLAVILYCSALGLSMKIALIIITDTGNRSTFLGKLHCMAPLNGCVLLVFSSVILTRGNCCSFTLTNTVQMTSNDLDLFPTKNTFGKKANYHQNVFQAKKLHTTCGNIFHKIVKNKTFKHL